MSSQLCGMPARLPRMHSGHRFMRNIKLMIPTRTDRSPSVSFFISGGVCADFCLHTAMVKRAQVHICYGDVDTSEHCVLFDLGWRLCGFLSSYRDGEASTDSYLLQRFRYIGTFSFLSRVTFLRVFIFTPRWWSEYRFISATEMLIHRNIFFFISGDVCADFCLHTPMVK